MRSHFALALLVFAAAAPAQAQRGQPVHRGDGYEIVLPAKCRLMPMEYARSFEEEGVQARLMAVSENTVVMVMSYGLDEIPDTTLATRRALLQLGRVGMLHASGEVELVGEPRNFERDDRVGIRVSVQMPPDKERRFALHGTAELSVPSRGDAALWMVMVFDQRHDAATTAAAERVLDSFHLTGAAPVAAEKGTVADGRGFVEATDLAAKP